MGAMSVWPVHKEHVDKERKSGIKYFYEECHVFY